MSEGVNATAVSTVDSPSSTTTLECRDERESPLPSSSSSSSSPTPPPPPPPLPPPEPPEKTSTNATTATTARKLRKHSTPAGTFLWIDGKKIRSALAVGKKWPPRPRRVSFPSNDTQLVTGYLEPANPWEHAENVNLEDLISSYKKSCERHCTEPLQNVVTQLEKLDITDDERCAELCLKHEYLDQKHCEPLEEILKRVQFEKIDLEATSLDDESAVTLFDMLEYYESAKHLNMSSNRDIASRGWHACAHMIKKTACLEQLEARDIPLTQQHMNILKRPLQLVSHLHVLKLENCSLAGRAFAVLVSALKMNTGLKELYLADNGLEPDDAIQLGALLRVNNHLQLLDISNNHIRDEGVGDILDGLINQSTSVRDGKGLSILVLWNNDLTKSSSAHFTQAIAQSITLETLNIGKNCVSNELLELAQDSLIQSRTLLQLGMQSTSLTCKGALLLADIVERNRTLQRIDLRDNNIQMTGLTALSFAMKKNTSITQLDLDEKPWSKIPAAMHQYLDLVAEIRGYCVRNEEPTSTDESTEESGSPEHRSRLSSVSSRKISLTCQTLPRSPPSMTPTTNEIGSRSMLEPKRTSGGRLRSPAPSPIPSPVASPIPSPSRSRFVVSRVSEASLSSTNSSASSSPVTSPCLASSPTCFFPTAERGSSRFRVTVVEPSSNVPTAKSVVTSANANVTIGFNYRIQTPESLDSDDSDSVFRSNDRASGNETSVASTEENGKATAAITSEKIQLCAEVVETEMKETKATTTITTSVTSAVSQENEETDKLKKDETNDDEKIINDQTDRTVKSGEQPSENGVVSNNILNVVENSVAVCTKESREPEVALEKLVEPSNPEIIETKGNSAKKTESSLRDEIMACFQPESKKPPESVQRQASSLERLLGLFQHPGSLFSSTYSEKSETKNPLQDGVNSMIALGDKFQQYLREGRGGIGKTAGTEDSPSHAPLQRSVSDASRSTIKLDPVKSLSIPQLSSIQATCTRDFSSRKDASKLAENHVENVPSETKPKTDSTNPPSRKMLVVEEENPSDGSPGSEKNREPRIRDLPLPENVVSSARETSENYIGASEQASFAGFSNDGMLDRTESAPDIASNAPLNVVSESKPTICAPKLKDIPEYSVLELARTNAGTERSEMCATADEVDAVIRNTNGQVGMKCDSSTTDSINDPSCKNSSVCKVTCDMKYVANVHTLGTAGDVHNFYNAPLSREIEMIIETPVECTAISVSSSTDDDRSVAIATAVEVLEDENTIGNNEDPGMSSDRPSVSSEEDLPVSDAKKIEDPSVSNVETQPQTHWDSATQGQAVGANSVDLLILPVLNNLCTNRLVDTESRDAQSDRVEETRFNNIEIATEGSQLSDTVEEFLPIDAVAFPIESSVVQRLNETVLSSKSVINNCIIDEHEFNVMATEDYQENYSGRVNDGSVTVSASDEKLIPTIDENVRSSEAITILDEFVSFPNATRATCDDFTLTKIDVEISTEYNYSIPTAIEQVSTSLSEDSDYSSKLSVDDLKTGELSLNGSTANSPGHDVIVHNVTESSIANNSLECTNSRSNEASLETSEHRSFVHVAVDSVLTSFVNITDTSTKLSSSTVNNSESTDDLIFRITDIITADTSSSSIVTTIEECGDVSGLVESYFEQGPSARSPTNLVIDKSCNVHRNSQDSGIEETTVSISDDNGIEGNGQPRDSFQESVDSGIDSECSSVCARIDLGADAQQGERARDPGKILNVETTISDGISIFPSNFLGKDEILGADSVVAKIAGNSAHETAIGLKKNPTRVTEIISMGRCNETTEQSSVLVRSTSPGNSSSSMKNNESNHFQPLETGNSERVSIDYPFFSSHFPNDDEAEDDEDEDSSEDEENKEKDRVRRDRYKEMVDLDEVKIQLEPKYQRYVNWRI